MRALKKAVDDGDIEKTTNNSYKLSIGLRRNLKEAAAETYKTKPEPESYKSLRADGDSSSKNKDGTMGARLRALKKKATKPKKAAPKKKAVSSFILHTFAIG